jgi:hypothetical protein
MDRSPKISTTYMGVGRPTSQDAKTAHCAASEMGPPLRPEIPKIFLERFRKTRAFTRPNAAVAHTMATAIAVRPLGQPPRADVSSAPARSLEDVAYSEFASYLLDVDGFALVREAGVILRQNLSVHYLDVSVVLASLRHCKKF